MSGVPFEKNLREDFQSIFHSLRNNVHDKMAMKNKGLGVKAQREFVRKSNKIRLEWHKEAALLGALHFLFDEMSLYNVAFNVNDKKMLAVYIEKIDIAFLNFDVDTLNKRVECDFNLGYNSMIKFYKKEYPNKIYNKNSSFGKRCGKRKKLNHVLLDRLKEVRG